MYTHTRVHKYTQMRTERERDAHKHTDRCLHKSKVFKFTCSLQVERVIRMIMSCVNKMAAKQQKSCYAVVAAVIAAVVTPNYVMNRYCC